MKVPNRKPLVPNGIYHGKAEHLIPLLNDGCVNLAISSPPYAMQRQKEYDSIPEAGYPEWTCEWMEALRPKLAADASVVLIIRPHSRDGVISDYVLRTRLALRDVGWFEIEELIWVSVDKPPFGYNRRPRRTYESLLWFAPSNRPYADPYAAGTPSKGLGGLRAKAGIDKTPLHRNQHANASRPLARMTDVITVPIGSIDKNVPHPAMMPRGVVRPVISMLSRPDDMVVDPFVGSGTVPLVCLELGRKFIGIDSKHDYVLLARQRLLQENVDNTKP